MTAQSSRICDKTTDTFVFEYLQALDCPRALTVWLLYVSKEHDQLSQLSWVPTDYNRMVDARDSLAATKFLSKADFLSTSFDREEVAMKGFWAAEQQCAEANKRIASGSFITKGVHAILYRMTQLIAGVLGEFDAEEFVDSCGWGPGASLRNKRNESHQPKKFDSENQATTAAIAFISPWFSAAYPLWWECDWEPVKGNKVITVPKNSKTDRTIAIEPGVNSWFQKGLGSMIRKRLRRHGIDLKRQSVNQQKAWVGSKFDSLATVDFSSASDTICRRLVEEVIPRDWLTLLGTFRSSYGQIGKDYHRYEKFSSMGNGYTFELETLIFYALAVATCERLGLETSDISVYGDDVIIPTAAFDLYASLARDLGFTVNKEKSYDRSPFRESCGSFYWSGTDVKPIYLKGKLDDYSRVLRTANSVRLLAHRRASRLGCDRSLLPSWKYLAQRLGAKTPVTPPSLGDSGLIGNRKEAEESRYKPERARHGHDGVVVRAIVDRPMILETDTLGLLLFRVKQIGSAELEYRNTVPMPGRTKRSLTRVLVPVWDDVGEWF